MITWFIKIFLYSSSVYFCHLFLIYSASLSPYHFCPYFACLCLKCSLVISNFLVEISSLSILFFSSVSFYWSPRKGFLCLLFFGTLHSVGISSLFSFAFHFSSFLSYLEGLLRQPFCLFCISFSCGWFWLPPSVQSHEPPSIVLQALCLSDLIPWICPFHCIIVRDLI